MVFDGMLRPFGGGGGGVGFSGFSLHTLQTRRAWSGFDSCLVSSR